MAHREINGTWRGAVGLLAALTIMGAAACSGGDDDDGGSEAADVPASSPEADAGDSAASGDDGGGDAGDSADAGGGDFPIPAPDGLVLDALVDAGLGGLQGQRQLYYENDDFDRVVAFYDDWTSQNGEWSRAEAEGAVVYQRLEGDGIRTITVTPDQDPGAQAEGPATFVLLIASG